VKRLSKEDRAGLYITVIVHLTVIIVLLSAQLGFAIKNESSFVMDFTKMEELEKLQKEVAFKEQISKKLEKMIADAGVEPIRNVAVDRSSLKDDRGTDAKKLYEDAKRLQKELSGGFKNSESESDYVEQGSKQENKEKKSQYSGPSVLSWTLDGRKASSLPIPAYRCMGAGEVTVIIGVDPSGRVVSASVQEDVSTSDKCLRNFAIRAARMSRFSSSPKAPTKQMGEIVYKFIAQ